MPASQVAAHARPVAAQARAAPLVRRWSGRDLVIALLVLAAVGWAYAATLRGLVSEWRHNEDYSVGWLVPPAVLYLVVRQRRRFASCTPRTNWVGLGLVLAAIAMRLEGLRSLFESAERYSLVLLIAGLVLFLTGWKVFWKARWLLLFLLLMIPLPGRVHNAVAARMQSLATAGTVVVLETLGVMVESEGNTLHLNGHASVGVAEACSGLRMLMAFIVVGAVLAFLIEGPAWQRAILVLSSMPIAILCNVVRLAVTALLFTSSESRAVRDVVHDFAGLAMMPLAILMLLVELWVLRKLVTPEPKSVAKRIVAHGT